MDDYMDDLTGSVERNCGDALENLQSVFGKLCVSTASRFLEKLREPDTESLEERFSQLKLSEKTCHKQPKEPRRTKRTNWTISRKAGGERKIKRRKLIRKQPKPVEEERGWLNRSQTFSNSASYYQPKVICTTEEVDGSMSDLYFQEEILLD